MRTFRLWQIILVSTLLSCTAVWGQNRYYVNPATGSPSFDGLSPTVGAFPAGPKSTVQDAVNAAATNDTIVLAAATYNESVLINAKDLTFNSTGTATIDSVAYTGGAGPLVKIAYTYSLVGINGGFGNSSNWVFNTGWSHNAGLLRADRASSSSVTALQSSIALVAGRAYRLTYTMNRTSFVGGIIPMVGGSIGTQQTASGTYSEEIRAMSTAGLAFYPVNSTFNFTGNIDNVVLEAKTETVATVRINKVFLASGDGNDIQNAVYLATPTTGRIWIGQGTYNFTIPVFVSKACRIYGQDTLTNLNTSGRRLLTSAGPTNFFNITTSGVTIKGFQMQLISGGNSNVAQGANTENACIVVGGASLTTTISNNHFQNNNSALIPNGVGVRAWDAGHSLIVRNCFFTSRDTNNLTSGFFSRGIWSESGRGVIENNWFLYGGLQDMLIRFTTNTFTIRYNRIRGYGMEVNTLGSSITISGNVFSQPAAQPAVAYGGLIGKGNSFSNTYTVSGNRFENYSVAALQVYGQSNMTISANTFIPPSAGDFTSILISTCSNPDACTAGNNVGNLTIKGNAFQNGASGQGTAIRAIRASAINSITSLTVGASGEENTFNSNLRTWILLDTTSGRPVTVNVPAQENFFAVPTGTKMPDAFTAQDHLFAEGKVMHYLDCGSAGTVTLKTNTYAVTNTGNCRYPQRGIDKLTDGGTLILSSVTPTYPPASISAKGITIQSYPSKARLLQLSVNAAGFTQDLSNSLTVTSSLALIGGIISSTTSDTLFLSPVTPSALTYGAGWISAHFNRGIASGQQYLFPIGFDTASRETWINFDNTSGGLTSLTAGCVAANPNTTPVASSLIPYIHGITTYSTLPANEYITLNPNQGSATWDISVKYPPLSGYNGFLLAKRATGSNVWQIAGDDNFPVPQGNNQFATGELKRDNLTGFSDITIAGGLNNPLPVRIDEYSLFREGPRNAWARWHVLEEVDVHQYVFTVSGMGESDLLVTIPADDRPVPKYYQAFLATQPDGQDVLVDLHSHDFDGTVQFIGTRVLTAKNADLKPLQVYPNPMHRRFQVTGGKFRSFSVIDQAGRQIFEGTLSGSGGTLPDLPPGLYSLQLYSPSGSANARIAVQ